MPSEIDRLFQVFRPSRFVDDPNAVPQERNRGTEPSGFIGDNSVDSNQIKVNAVIADKISANAVIADKIAANAVTTDKLNANAVTTAKLAAGSVTATEIAANAVTTDKLNANAVTAAKVAADTITANEIAANAITATEIAADAVTTNKILAANVTSAKIALTLTGKTYGATAGSQSAPGIFFDAASTVGMTLTAGGGGLVLAEGSGASDAAVIIDGGWVEVRGGSEFTPGSDNTMSCGVSATRWVDVWAVNGTIQTSDARDKTDIADAPLGLGFIRRLLPRVFRWKDTVDTQARAAVKVDKEAMAVEAQPHIRRVDEIREEQAANKLSDEAAEALVVAEREALAEIKERFYGPAREARQMRRPGKRLHYGLIAQEVKQALDDAGVDSKDAGFWIETETGDQALQYTQLIVPLIKAVQELASRVEELEAAP